MYYRAFKGLSREQSDFYKFRMLVRLEKYLKGVKHAELIENLCSRNIVCCDGTLVGLDHNNLLFLHSKIKKKR